MLEVAKQYGSPQDSPIDELKITLSIFKIILTLIDEPLIHFDATLHYEGNPTDRSLCLNRGAEFVQSFKKIEIRFIDLSRKMKLAYEICYPSDELTNLETIKAQFYLAIRSIIYKQTNENTPDAEMMNAVVHKWYMILLHQQV